MKNRIFFLALLLIVTSGCALRRDVVYLDDRIDGVEKRLSLQKVEAEEATKQVREATNQAKVDYAKLSNQYDGLSEKIRLLQGNYDENSHRIDKTSTSSDRLKADIDKLGSLITKLDGLITDLSKRIGKLEEYTGINSVTVAATTPDPAKKDGTGDAAAPPDVKLFNEAKAAMDGGDQKTARENFQKYIKDYPASKTIDTVQFLVAETYFLEKWYQKAILEYQKVIEAHPKSPKVPTCYLKQGLSFLELGEGANAKLIFTQLIKKFPNSSDAAIAKKKLEKPKKE